MAPITLYKDETRWYPILLAALTLPGVWLGGFLKAEHNRL